MTISFYKYQGTGNDFIMIDNRNQIFPKNNIDLINHLCDRRFGIGADGLILLENAEGVDFKMVYFNADGNESSMCGNGGRCIVAFAKYLNIITDETSFIAIDGLHEAFITSEEVKLKMQDVAAVETHDAHLFLDTGSPHHVEMISNLEDLNIQEKGAEIRYGAPYFEKGSNVNFVKKVSENSFKMRTYERGVEAETLSCGTGATAVAIAMYHSQKTNAQNIQLQVEGGVLEVSFAKIDEKYTDIYLKGPTKQVFKGEFVC